MTAFAFRDLRRPFLILSALLASLPASPSLAAPPAAANGPRDFIAFNLGVRSLPEGWVWRDVADPTSQLIGLAAKPSDGQELVIKAFTVGIERMRSPDDSFGDLQALILIRGTSLTGVKKVASTVGGVDGLRITADSHKDNVNARFVGFVGAKGGREYQIGLFTGQPTAEAQAMADDLLSRFELIDPSASVRLADLADAPPFFTPIYKYRFALPAGWSKPLSPQLKPLYVDYCSMFADHTCVTVTPSLLLPTTTPDEVAAVVLKMYGWDANLLTPKAKFGAGRFTGYRFTRDAVIGGRPGRERLQLWVGEGIAIYAQATTTFKDPDLMLNEAVSGMDLGKIVGATDPDIRTHLLSTKDLFSAKRPPREKGNMRGFLQNELGVQAMERGNSRDAAQLFELALQYQLDPMVAGNLLDALIANGQIERARELAPLAAARFGTDPRVTPAVAHVYDTAGDRSAYLALGKSIAEGTDVYDDLVYFYAVSLLDDEKYDAVSTLLANYKKRSNGPLVLDLEARLLNLTGRSADAVALLDKNLKDAEKHPLLRQTLVRCLLHENQTDRATLEIDKLKSDGVSDRDIAVCRGQLYIALGDSTNAKAEFDKARSLGLPVAEADAWIALTDRLSVQGKNASVRAEIAPVAIPSDLLADRPSKPLDRSMGAAYRRASVAVHY